MGNFKTKLLPCCQTNSLDATEPQFPLQILKSSRAFIESQCLFTAVELDLFTVLSKNPLSAEKIIKKCELNGRGAEDFLDTLVSLNLLQCQGEGVDRIYMNTPEDGIVQTGPWTGKGNNISRWNSQGNLEERIAPWDRGGMNQKSASYGSLNAKDSQSQEGSLESQQHRKAGSQRVHVDNVAIAQRSNQNGNDFSVQEIRGGEASLYNNSNEESVWKQPTKIWTSAKTEEKKGVLNNREVGVGQLDFQQSSHLQDACSTSQTDLQGIDAEMIARFGIDDIEEEEQWQSWNRTNVIYKEEQQNDIRKPREIRGSNYFTGEPQGRKLPSVETSQLVSNKPVEVVKGSSQMTNVNTAPLPIKAKVVGIKMDKQLQAQGIQLPEDLHPDQCSSDAVNSPTPTHTQQSLAAAVSAGQHVESIQRLPHDFDNSVTFVKSQQQPHQQQIVTNISPSLYHVPQQQQYECWMYQFLLFCNIETMKTQLF
eukprot:TRINITY_DN7416_c0_g1_i1.p1 TRINITY_DN7416_c0_g1~~TRINITY_DN7416_c0_g1_i1.p1  ORF type:complete len:480 (+),score=49.18 TRINITY_DN7416_c0_g1_i1:82-1521(+)